MREEIGDDLEKDRGKVYMIGCLATRGRSRCLPPQQENSTMGAVFNEVITILIWVSQLSAGAADIHDGYKRKPE